MRTLDSAAPPLARRSPAAARIVAVEGDVDALAAARLSASICSLGVGRIVLDLTGVGAIDAAAVRDLVLAARVVGLSVDIVAPPRASHADRISR